MNRIKKGDKVKVISGKDSGKIGEVVAYQPKLGKVLVEGVNIIKRHTKRTQDSDGGIIEKSQFFNASKVMLLDSKDSPTRVKFVVNDKGVKVRTGKNNKVLDK